MPDLELVLREKRVTGDTAGAMAVLFAALQEREDAVMGSGAGPVGMCRGQRVTLPSGAQTACPTESQLREMPGYRASNNHLLKVLQDYILHAAGFIHAGGSYGPCVHPNTSYQKFVMDGTYPFPTPPTYSNGYSWYVKADFSRFDSVADFLQYAGAGTEWIEVGYPPPGQSTPLRAGPITTDDAALLQIVAALKALRWYYIRARVVPEPYDEAEEDGTGSARTPCLYIWRTTLSGYRYLVPAADAFAVEDEAWSDAIANGSVPATSAQINTGAASANCMGARLTRNIVTSEYPHYPPWPRPPEMTLEDFVSDVYLRVSGTQRLRFRGLTGFRGTGAEDAEWKWFFVVKSSYAPEFTWSNDLGDAITWSGNQLVNNASLYLPGNYTAYKVLFAHPAALLHPGQDDFVVTFEMSPSSGVECPFPAYDYRQGEYGNVTLQSYVGCLPSNSFDAVIPEGQSGNGTAGSVMIPVDARSSFVYT